MKLNSQVRECLEKSVLCWLATASKDNIPNVSPKEIFTYYQADKIVVANIASPKTLQNIKENKYVCVSFIDILVQKGYQIKGQAEIVDNSYPDFSTIERSLNKMTEGKFPFTTVTMIDVEQVRPIVAPKYIIYPETTECEQIESAKKSYGFNS